MHHGSESFLIRESMLGFLLTKICVFLLPVLANFNFKFRSKVSNILDEECWETEVCGLAYGLAQWRARTWLVVSPAEVSILWPNWEREVWRIKLNYEQEGNKRPAPSQDIKFYFKTEITAEEPEKTPSGGLPLICAGTGKQRRPTSQQLTQNQSFTPADWSICNSKQGTAMKPTFCSWRLQELI